MATPWQGFLIRWQAGGSARMHAGREAFDPERCGKGRRRMGTARETSERSLEARLGRAGQRIDAVVAKARHTQGDGKGRVGRRVDALRAHEAQTRTRLRELHEADQTAGDEHIAELGQELDELDVETAIVEAQLDADLAADSAAFAAAVQAELGAWSTYIDVMQAEAATSEPYAREQRETAIRRVRERRAAARQRLQEYRDASNDASATLRVRVSQAMDDLDRAAEEAVARFN
jgi:hypothetical protein